ncbi:hypothetical protein CJJ19_10045 [Candidatus Williamhamiltonella defendens]|nr:hypothetical protein CJJ19_10045 [Candidatus Hamiltonella defensa]
MIFKKNHNLLHLSRQKMNVYKEKIITNPIVLNNSTNKNNSSIIRSFKSASSQNKYFYVPSPILEESQPPVINRDSGYEIVSQNIKNILNKNLILP